MVHRILTPSSPYTTSTSTPPASKGKVPVVNDVNQHQYYSRQQIGKENLTSNNTVPTNYRHQASAVPAIIAPSSSSFASSSSSASTRPPDSPLLSSAYISSPQLSTFVAAAPAPSYAAAMPVTPTVTAAGVGSTSHFVSHYHRPTAAHQQQKQSSEPSMAQLLAEQPKGLNHYSSRAAAAAQDRDSTMANATGVASWRKGQGFKEWEKVKLNSAEVKRKADVAQLCEYPNRCRALATTVWAQLEDH